MGYLNGLVKTLYLLGVCSTTVDSPVNKNAPCIIPFKYKGILRKGCITEDDPDGRHWCSTKVDENLLHVRGNWGYCRSTCPKETTSTTNTNTSTTREQSANSLTKGKVIMTGWPIKIQLCYFSLPSNNLNFLAFFGLEALKAHPCGCVSW